jgi:YHS domain-containing protein
MNRRNLLSVAAVLLTANSVFAAEPEIYAGAKEGFGSGGFDPVSYQQDGGPKMGVAANTLEWKGAKWQFVSPDNLAAFKANPDKYAPQFGGYCAYAVSKGATAPGDPKVFTIVDGKLYLNYSKDVQVTWKKDVPGNISLANGNWPKVLDK